MKLCWKNKSLCFNVLFINFPMQNLCRHWRVSLEIRCTSSTYAWPSFSSTLLLDWSPTNPNTWSNTMASHHQMPIFSWVSRVISIIHNVYLVWMIFVRSFYLCTVDELETCSRPALPYWLESLQGHKCFTSQHLIHFYAAIPKSLSNKGCSFKRATKFTATVGLSETTNIEL